MLRTSLLIVLFFGAFALPLTAIGDDPIPSPTVGDGFFIDRHDERLEDVWVTYTGIGQTAGTKGQTRQMLFFESASKVTLIPTDLFQMLAGYRETFSMDGVTYTIDMATGKPDDGCIGYARRVSTEKEFPGSISGIYCYSPHWGMVTAYRPKTGNSGFTVTAYSPNRE